MKKNILIVGLLIIAVVAVVELKNRKSGSDPAGCADGMCTLPIPESKIHPDAIQHQPGNENPLPRLLDLGAGKCVSCKAMASVLDEMKASYAGQLNVDFIDVWENEDATSTYGIRLIPTQIFYDAEGNELFRHEGFFARADMLAKWAELGYHFTEAE